MSIIRSDTEIGTAIRARRWELGLTQENLASFLGITCQQIQRYECGKNRLNVDNLQRISKALAVPVSYFFLRKDPTFASLTPPRLSTTERTLLERLRQLDNDSVKEMIIKLVGIAAKEEGDRIVVNVSG